uniref:60S ribosomal protein L18 n=1 Tax=Metchnikovella dogieli TaxID=2804710 RepID=A0A896WRP2_9MICR|nr:60S ribosomal protein L18 [Metchnikovella dogieli]
MGIDMWKVKAKKSKKSQPESKNAYLLLLCKIYDVLAARTDSQFNKSVRAYLGFTKLNKAPVSLSRIQKKYEEIEEVKGINSEMNEVFVVVGPVVSDERLHRVRKMTIVGLRFTKTARMRIGNAGGQCLTFDQLALLRPTGENCVLLRGDITTRKSAKSFGIPGKREGVVPRCASKKSFKKTEGGSMKTKKKVKLFRRGEQ